jgi:hypothetical protein
VLLGASNQPVWSNTTWIGALFLASAASTGIATMVLMNRALRLNVAEAVTERLESLDSWAIVLELVLLLAMTVSLGRLALNAFGTLPGALIPLLVVPFGLVVPLALQRWTGACAAVPASVLVLLGGFVLRVAVVGMPPPLLVSHHG